MQRPRRDPDLGGHGGQVAVMAAMELHELVPRELARRLHLV